MTAPSLKHILVRCIQVMTASIIYLALNFTQALGKHEIMASAELFFFSSCGGISNHSLSPHK